MDLIKVPIRYAFNKSIQLAFQTGPTTKPSYTFAPYASHGPTASFKPQYVAPFHPPRTDQEAQRLYNHIRTVAWYLDAIPLLGNSFPIHVGIDVSSTSTP